MKKFVMLLMLLSYAFVGLTAGLAPPGPVQSDDIVYFTTNRAEADLVIYVVSNRAQADLTVCKTDNSGLARSDSGYWLVTDNRGLADKIVYVSSSWCNECTAVYYTENSGLRSGKPEGSDKTLINGGHNQQEVYANQAFY